MDPKKTLAYAGAAGFLFGLAFRSSSSYSFEKKVVLVTGGSRGLGLLLARELQKEKARLVLVARDEEELARAASSLSDVEVLTIAADLTKDGECERVVRETLARFGRVDVLINNAGSIQVAPLSLMKEEDFDYALKLHMWAPLRLSLACLPSMREQGAGRIVNISSVGGKIAIPHLVPYSVSKFALVGLSDGLRAELSRENILVTTVCPGLMRTGSVGQVQFKGRAEWEKTWFAWGNGTPLVSAGGELSARKILRACREGRPFLTFTPTATVGIRAQELFPNFTARMLGLVNRVLPSSNGDDSVRLGKDLPYRAVPPLQKHLIEKATRENNEAAS